MMASGSVKCVARNERWWRMYHSSRPSGRKSASLGTECRAEPRPEFFEQTSSELFSAHCNPSRADGRVFFRWINNSSRYLKSVIICVDCARFLSNISLSENVSYISTALNGGLWHRCVTSPKEDETSDSSGRLTRLTFVNSARSLAATLED